MNIQETNEFINNYIENYKPKSAIMLNGPWGIGKSYYINKELPNHIKRDCVVVSLYGLENLDEVSRKIYLEVNSKNKKKCKVQNNKPRTEKDKKNNYKKTNKNVNIEKFKFAYKTVIQGILSICNIDLKLGERHIKKLFKAVNLTKKLLILEDVERSSINIKEILGYVSNLVEYDDVKVMLVANENELFKEEDKKAKEEYRKQKEKTIGDTILFLPCLDKPLKEIYDSFNDSNLNELAAEYGDIFVEIENKIIFGKGINNPNLRLVMYALQKTTELLNNITLDMRFKKLILMSNIAYTLRKPNLKNNVWAFENKSPIFGTNDYPLYKFSYDYLNYSILNKDEIIDENQKYINYLKITNRKTELRVYIDKIYSYNHQKEIDLIEAITKINENLKGTLDIEYVEYGDIAMNIIFLRTVIDCNNLVQECLDLMKQNIMKFDKVAKIEIFRYAINCSEDQKEETTQFLKEINELIERRNNKDILNNDKDIFEKCDELIKNKDNFYNKRTFASLINNENLIEKIKKYDCMEIEAVRGVYLEIYRSTNIKDFFEVDLEPIKDLKIRIDKIKDDKIMFDGIQRLQLKWFSENLEDIIERLNK